MEQVDFYIVESEAVEALELVACQLAEKAWTGGFRLFIRTADADQAARMDKALWTFRQGSFLPHAMAGDDADEPILLGTPETPPPAACDMLINLAPTPAEDAIDFRRVAEVACRRSDLLKAARERFRWYRDQGFSPANHTIPARNRE